MAKKIVCAGMLCLDITPVFKQSAEQDALRLLSPGKLIDMDAASISVGGSVANSGLAFSFFGAEVELVAKIADDHFGELIEQILRQHGATSPLGKTDECGSSYTVVLAPPGIDRIFLHYAGADHTFGYDDIDFDMVASADLFHLGYPTVMKRLYENGAAELLQIFGEAKRRGVYTSLDMAAIDPTSPSAKVDWRAVLERLMPSVDFFVPSVEELCFLLDRERHDEWMARSGGGDVTHVLDLARDIQPLADQLIAWGAKIVLIKCGAPGMYLRTASADQLRPLGEAFSAWADLALFEPSYEPDRYRSGTGAGDVSLAAFLLAALSGHSPARSLQLATAAGACCVSTYDALSGLIPFPEMIARIDGGWPKRQDAPPTWRPGREGECP